MSKGKTTADELLIGTALSNFMKFRGIRSWMYIEDLL